MEAPTQAVILIGGLGSRLGSLTADTPKPLLPVGGAPFLDVLVGELRRFGFDSILLLAGYRADQVVQYVDAKRGVDVNLDVLVEPEPLGTAGALRLAAPRLERDFMLLNGDSWFDTNLLALVPHAARHRDAAAVLLLREERDASRFGTVELAGDWITGFRVRGTCSGGLVNAGVYLCRRAFVADVAPRSSLEGDVFPSLAAAGRLAGLVRPGFFIDIGVPEAYAAAQDEIPKHLLRPAIFVRFGLLGDPEVADTPQHGARSGREAAMAVRLATDAGYRVFAFAEPHIAGGRQTANENATARRGVRSTMRAWGAVVESVHDVSQHDGKSLANPAEEVEEHVAGRDGIRAVMQQLPILVANTCLISDMRSDMEIARGAGITGHLIERESLLSLLQRILTNGQDET